MKLLSFNDQRVAYLAPHDQQYNLVTLYIIQNSQGSCPQLESG